MDRRLYGTQSRSGRGGEEKNSQLLPGLELLIIHPVAQCYTIELSRLQGRCYRFITKSISPNKFWNTTGIIIPHGDLLRSFGDEMRTGRQLA
jgi:hypothetical protein